MEHRTLGRSGLKVPVLTFGTGTFGGKGELFGAWGNTDVAGARRLVDVCLDAGLAMFDTADVYSAGAAESILGEALAGRRERALVSTKATFRTGTDVNDASSSRMHLVRAIEASLRRLRTDHIDLFQLHGFDASTPVEETLSTLDDLVKAGKIRYVGCSNFSGWQLMKSISISERHGWARHVAHQAYYSLVAREYEWELLPLGIDQGVGCMVWSPLGWGRLTGKLGRGKPLPEVSRLRGKVSAETGPQVPDDRLFTVLDALDEVGKETGRSVPEVAIRWLLQRPTVASVIIGARDEKQLRQNLGAVDFVLSPEQMTRLERASETPMIYPYWHQASFAELRAPR